MAEVIIRGRMPFIAKSGEFVPPDLSRTGRPPRGVMVWDGDCAFCRRWIARWARVTGDAIEYTPYQQAGGRFAAIATGAFAEAVHLIEPDGTTTRGAAAVFRSMALAGRAPWMERAYRNVPLVARACESAYRFVARHRGALDRLERAISNPAPPTRR